ncbi:hypothetical protein Tco_0854537, partial [Tanacetum coccineum]
MVLPSTLNEGTRKSKPLPEGTATHPKGSRGNIQPLDRDSTSATFNEGTAKTTLRPEGLLRNKDSKGNIPPADMEPIHNTVADPSGIDVRAFLLSDDEAQESENDILGAGEDIDKYIQSAEIHHQSSPPQEDKPTSSTTPHTEASDSESSSEDIYKKYDNTLPLTKIQLNIAHKDQTDKLVEACMSSLKKSRTATSDLYKGLNVITELLKVINNAVKDDPAMNKKISKATESFSKIFTNIIELAAWAKFSTNMALNLGSRIS